MNIFGKKTLLSACKSKESDAIRTIAQKLSRGYRMVEIKNRFNDGRFEVKFNSGKVKVVKIIATKPLHLGYTIVIKRLGRNTYRM